MADLEFNHIVKTFNGVYALKDVSFSCNRGEVHALLGENGAGKSTLLKVLSGAHRPDSGEIKIFGETVELKSPKDAMEKGIGTVYQELSIIPDLTVADNIFIGRIPKNRCGLYDRKKLFAMTQELLTEYEIEDIHPGDVALDLSLSQKQMVEILRVLSKDPQIVIFDEATSALTDERVKWLLAVARKLACQQKIVIFISHRMSEIKDACDNITILRNGMNTGEMSTAEVNMDYVISCMLGRKMEGYYPEKKDVRKKELALEVKNLTYLHILNGVNLKLHKGEVLGIGGLAGQGQVELLLALAGAIRAKGEILSDGKRVKLHSIKEGMKHGIALIPEERATQGLALSFSVGDNISLPSLHKVMKGPFIDRKKEKAIIDKYMEMFSIKADGAEMAVENLSGGNQQKVVLAKMMSTEPTLVLMHDITRGVDVGTKKEMFQLVRDLAGEGKAVIYFSTDVEELVNVCDRVLVMFDGKIGADLEGEDLTREHIVGASIGESVARKGEAG